MSCLKLTLIILYVYSVVMILSKTLPSLSPSNASNATSNVVYKYSAFNAVFMLIQGKLTLYSASVKKSFRLKSPVLRQKQVYNLLRTCLEPPSQTRPNHACFQLSRNLLQFPFVVTVTGVGL